VLATFSFAGRWRGVGAGFGAVARTLLFENKKYFLSIPATVADRRRNEFHRIKLVRKLMDRAKTASPETMVFTLSAKCRSPLFASFP
jgi:hypothetical protein